MQRLSAVVIPAIFLAALLSGVLGAGVAQAEGGTEFVGTVLSVDTDPESSPSRKTAGEAGSLSSPMRRPISTAGRTQ